MIEFDGQKGVFLPDWEVLLCWLNVLEERNANLYAQKKEELRRDVLRSRSGVRLVAHPPSPTCMPKDPSKGETGEEQVGDGDAEEEDS